MKLACVIRGGKGRGVVSSVSAMIREEKGRGVVSSVSVMIKEEKGSVVSCRPSVELVCLWERVGQWSSRDWLDRRCRRQINQ